MKTPEKKFRNKKVQMLILIAVLGVICFSTFKFTRHSKKVAVKSSHPENVSSDVNSSPPEIPLTAIPESPGIKNDRQVFPVSDLPSGAGNELAHYKVNPPVPALAEKPVIKSIDAGKGAFIKYKSGTRIIIPPGAFVDKKGKPVEGNVDVAYKEFRNAYDIFISGIPMKYDSGGTTFQFESASMMELTASLDNKPVYVNPNKRIKVNLASDTRETNYNLYYFDPKKGNWTNKGKESVKVIYDTATTVSSQTRTNNPALKMYAYEQLPRGNSSFYCAAYHPSKRVSIFSKMKTPAEFVIRFRSSMFKAYPEFKSFRNTGWSYKDNDAEFVYERLFWQQLKKNKLASISDYWNGVSLQHDNESEVFTLTFYSERDSVSLEVVPVNGNNVKEKLFGSKTKDKKLNEKYGNYLSVLDEVNEKENARYRKYQADSVAFVYAGSNFNPEISRQIVRSFEVDGFGVWNVDRILKDQSVVTMNVKFTDAENNPLPLKTVYLVDKQINSLMTYDVSGLNRFSFNPGRQNVIWAVLPDNRLAYVLPSEFLPIKRGQKSYTFRMKVLMNAEEGMKEVRTIFNI